MSGIIRQGDVAIIPIDSVPNKTKKVKRDNGRVVLAYGEVTGHCHAIVEEHCDLVSAEGAQDLYLLVYGDEVALQHEEHDTLTIPPGTYEVRRQREYSPEEIRRVAD